jgi:hypothetical protein
MSADPYLAAAGVVNAYASGQAAKAAAIQSQTGYLLQARNALAIADVRANYADQYAAIQAGRMLKKAEMEAINYKMAGNQLLRNLRKTNAAARARAAARGVVVDSGSNLSVQLDNVAATMSDLAIADFNALAARVFGFEDASALMESTQIQNIVDQFAAKQGAGQAEMAGAAGIRTAGLLANAKLTEAGVNAMRTTKGTARTVAPANPAAGFEG